MSVLRNLQKELSLTQLWKLYWNNEEKEDNAPYQGGRQSQTKRFLVSIDRCYIKSVSTIMQRAKVETTCLARDALSPVS